MTGHFKLWHWIEVYNLLNGTRLGHGSRSKRADAETTPSYFLRPTYLGIIMSLLDNISPKLSSHNHSPILEEGGYLKKIL